MTTNTFPLSLSPEYCSDWTPADGLREIVQNCLDSPADFHYEYISDTETLHLTSRFTTLARSTLLLGQTSKKGEAESVGCYGEGYKIAMLVLCREGYNIHIENGMLLWTPKYEYSDVFESTALVVHESPLEFENSHLTFTIKGVSEELMQEVKDKCLYLQSDEEIGDVIESDLGRVLENKRGQLFVGGLYVSDTNLAYGYDFNPDVLALNRDRKTVDSWDLTMATAKLWIGTHDHDKVAEMIHSSVEDVSKVQYQDKSEELLEACLGRFKEFHKGKFVVSCQADKDEYELRGVDPSSIVVLNDNFSSLVRRADDYEEPEFEDEQEEELTPLEEFDKLLDEMTPLNILSDESNAVVDEFRELYEMFKEKGVRWE
jgi:hypothetical protein